MEIQEQKATVDLPVLLVDARGSTVRTTHPGLEQMGYLAIPGELEYGLTLGSEDSDPSQVTVTLRLLTARYSPPPGCSPRVLELVNRVNAALAHRLLGEKPSGGDLLRGP